MSDKPVVLDVPEDLLLRAQAAHVDIRRVFIDAVEKEVRLAHGVQEMREIAQAIQALPDEMKPTPEEIDAEIKAYRREQAAKQNKIAL